MACLASSLILVPVTWIFLFADHGKLSLAARLVSLIGGVVVGLLVTLAIEESVRTGREWVKRLVWMLPMLGSVILIVSYAGSSFLAVFVFLWAISFTAFVAGVAAEQVIGRPIYLRELNRIY